MKDNILNQFSLKNKVAVITASTRGLGQSMAEGLAEAGATVVALDRSENDHLPQYCKSLGGTFKRINVDLLKATPKELDKIIDSVVEKFAHVDILVNNAGITRRAEIETFIDKDWLEVMQVNLNVPFYLSRAVSRHYMRQKSGKIINIASIMSFQGGLRIPSYSASKHALVGLTKSLANSLAKHGINVNAIAPGFFLTDMNIPLQQDKARNEQILKRVSAGRWGQPDELKGVLVWLASEASSFVNGSIVVVDGGWLAS